MMIRNMTSDDFDAIMRIQEKAYYALEVEDRNVLESKFQFGKEFCFVCEWEGEVKGYLLAYPWELASIPHLYEELSDLPECCDSVYLHDMAIHPEFHGRQAGRHLYSAFEDAVRRAGWLSIHLTAVQNADSFWMKMGYEIVPDHGLDLSSYGDAYVMRKRLY